MRWSARYAKWPVFLGIGIVCALFALPFAETMRAQESRRSWTQSYREVAPQDVAQMIRDGKKVVFVDVREPEEFAERHIPGARSIPVRDTMSLDVTELADADLVVPYCLKDFRGFEGAKTLQKMGVPNVGLLKGYGIKSWQKAHLPEAGAQVGTLDEAGLQQIQAAVEQAPAH